MRLMWLAERPHDLKLTVPVAVLGAFAGLRIAEVAGLKVADVDFIRGVVHPRRQWPDAPLKTAGAAAPIPVPRELTLMLSASVQRFGTEWMLTNGRGKMLRAVDPGTGGAQGL
jgi:integrase